MFKDFLLSSNTMLFSALMRGTRKGEGKEIRGGKKEQQASSENFENYLRLGSITETDGTD